MPPTIFPSWTAYLATCAVLALAQAVYVLFGFGAGLIAVGTLAMLFPEIRDVVVLLLLVNLPAELGVVARSRGEIRWRGVAALLVGIFLGIPLGAYLLKTGDPRFVLLLLGGFLIAVGAVFLGLPERRPVRWPRWAVAPVGLVSGVLTGMFGTGGPPLIIWYRLQGLPKSAFRGNLMAIFLMMTVVRVPSYVVSGLVTEARLWSGLAVMPAALAGAWLGHRIHVRIAERTFQRLVSVVLVLIGLVLLLRR
jgi:uncharacterized membrane protein YfcA